MDREKVREFMEQFMGMTTGAALLAVTEVAGRTGLLSTLAGRGPQTLGAIAAACGLQERYLRETLSALAAGQILRYDPAQETFELTAEAAACLADEKSPYFLGGWTQFLPALYRAIPGVARSMREGGGVGYAEFGSEAVEAIDRANSPGMRVLLTRKWLPTLPHVVKRLEQGARVADIGCGSGTSTLSLAKAYPRSEITGYDIDATALARARAAAEREGLANVHFNQRSAEDLPQKPSFELVTAFDVVHDLARPRVVLRRIREALAPDGTFLLVEPAAGDSLAENLHPGGALLYSISTLYCMTVSLSQGGEGLGAAYGPKQAEALCREAGFAHFRRLEIENPFNAFYEVRP
ncbi:MAG TPA: class I SAM-dependent methyltransferase [Myxococcota bacterium]|nr:class I SAM-dependent methyltransferase [Myxococcota bacterium]